jgi:flavin-binding protein dodecin
VAQPFQNRSSSLFSKVLGGPARRGAIQEIEGLLCDATRICDVRVEQVGEVVSRYGVEFGKRLLTPRMSLYRRFLEHCLLDSHISEDESRDIAHLRGLLDLDDDCAARVHDQVSRQVYGAAIDQVLEDQQLDPDEEEFLGQLRGQLELPDEVADALLAEGVQRARQRFFSKSAARSSVFLTSREAPLQLVGASQSSIEGAVHDALEQACRAVPRLHWVEVSKIRGEVVDGRVQEWQVELKAWLDPET